MWQHLGPIPVLQGVVFLDRALEVARQAPLSGLCARLQEIRGLRFAHPVPWEVRTRPQVEQFLRETMERDYPHERSRFDERMLVELGLVPRDFRLRPYLHRLLAEQVQGAYDPFTRSFFVVPQKSHWMTKLLNPGGPDMMEILALHELDHALGDQVFDLQGMTRAVARRSTDEQMAFSSLLEGDATLAMLLFAHGEQSVREMVGLGALGEMLGALPGLGEFSSAPLYFKRALVFPYYAGADFVTEGWHRGGWKRVDSVYANPPRSTEQVLHPEKYYSGSDPPLQVSLPLPPSLSGWSKLGEDTGGEFLLRVLLEEYGVPEFASAAAGWGGDRLAVYSRGPLSFVAWLTLWDDEAEAEEFAAAARQLRGSWTVQRRDRRVAVLRHVPAALAPRLLQALFTVRPPGQGRAARRPRPPGSLPPPG